MPWGDASVVRSLLAARTWAVVGLSPLPARPSYQVASFLLGLGRTVIPVNPGVEEVLGQPAYPSLSALPGPVDVVDVFRRPAVAGVVVDEALGVGAGGIWLQLGVIDEAAYQRAVAAGVPIVMDRCPRIEWPRYGTS